MFESRPLVIAACSPTAVLLNERLSTSLSRHFHYKVVRISRGIGTKANQINNKKSDNSHTLQCLNIISELYLC